MKTFQGVTRQGNQSEIMHSRGFTCLCVKIYNEKSPSYHFALIIQLSFHRKPCIVISFSFFFLWFYLFLEGKGRRKGEKHRCLVACHAPPTGDLACNSDMCPEWESNQRPFCSQADSQPTEPHQPGLIVNFLLKDHSLFNFSLDF